MDIDLSEDQALLREATRKFLEAEVPLATVPLARGPAGRLRPRRVAPRGRAGQDLDAGTAGVVAAAWHPGSATAKAGTGFIGRQQGAIGGGTAEMARNVISEQVLRMPREPAADRGIPFDDVRHNARQTR